MNACALEFGDGSFDAVLDKGTMDSVLCGEGSINNVANLCMEVSRCGLLSRRRHECYGWARCHDGGDRVALPL